MRLTKKNNGTGSWTQLGDKYLPAHNVKHKECVNKLGQLEDIEERIGIDLVTLFKILEMLDKTIRNGERGDSYVNLPDGTTFSTDMGYVEEFIERFKKLINDYGKTWTLTKEEK